MNTTTDPAELTLLRNRAISELRVAHPNLTWEQARNQARRSNPELFGLPSRADEGAAAEARAVRNRENIKDSESQAFAISEGIRELRLQNPKMGYEQARNTLRKKNPTLFGL